jgi:hypothetical protein
VADPRSAARLDVDPSWFHVSITPDLERQLALNDGSTAGTSPTVVRLSFSDDALLAE